MQSLQGLNTNNFNYFIKSLILLDFFLIFEKKIFFHPPYIYNSGDSNQRFQSSVMPDPMPVRTIVRPDTRKNPAR